MLLECGFVPDDPFFIFVESFFYFNSEGFYLRILFLKGVFRYLNLCFQVFKLLFKLFCVRALVKSVTYFLILQKLTLLFKFLNISWKQYITLQIELFHPSYFDSMIFQAVFQVLRQQCSLLAQPDFSIFEPPLSMHTWRISRSLLLSCLFPENPV